MLMLLVIGIHLRECWLCLGLFIRVSRAMRVQGLAIIAPEWSHLVDSLLVVHLLKLPLIKYDRSKEQLVLIHFVICVILCLDGALRPMLPRYLERLGQVASGLYPRSLLRCFFILNESSLKWPFSVARAAIAMMTSLNRIDINILHIYLHTLCWVIGQRFEFLFVVGNSYAELFLFNVYWWRIVGVPMVIFGSQLCCCPQTSKLASWVL